MSLCKSLNIRTSKTVSLYKSNFEFQADLRVGDMILAVNTESFMSVTYDEVINSFESSDPPNRGHNFSLVNPIDGIGTS